MALLRVSVLAVNKAAAGSIESGLQQLQLLISTYLMYDTKHKNTDMTRGMTLKG